MNINPQRTIPNSERRGSTLIIVIALLGLLAFTGMVFFTFAAQERAAAEYFSEGAKSSSEEVEDPFPWALQQMLVGATNQPEQKASILWSPTQRHSIVRNMIGRDIAPHTGSGLHVQYLAGLPVVLDASDSIGDALSNRLNFVDALSAWGGTTPAFTFGRGVEGILGDRRDYADEDKNLNGILDAGEDTNGNGTLDVNRMQEPDVDYTYPDLNHLFLAYKGWAIRDNGSEEDTNLNGILDGAETDVNGNGQLDRRYEQVRVIIPSFFRPQYLKSGPGRHASGLDVPTDPDWFNETVSLTHQQYAVRSFRPHALHISGFDGSGNAVLRYLDKNNPAHVAAIAALPGNSGHFPLRRNEGNVATQFNGPNFGRLGVWTGDTTAAAEDLNSNGMLDPGEDANGNGVLDSSSPGFELDSDNDGDGIREGIWLDLRYPLQETADGRKYTVLHSFTIYDLDGLIDLNVHGNLAGLPRNETINNSLVGVGNLMSETFLSQSNLGVGPHEISPLYALAPKGSIPDASTAFTEWYTANPVNRLEQANMEWAWLMAGRIDGAVPAGAQVFDGRWGDASALWYHRFTGGARRVNALPRPGRAGNLSQASSDVINNFGGALGFDDNQDVLEGIASSVTGRKRGFIHPLDFSGRGRRTSVTDPRYPDMHPANVAYPEQWVRYTDYPVVGDNAGIADETVYIAGKDGDITTAADNLSTLTDSTNQSNYNTNFEDPYETIMDQDRAVRPDDQIFSIADLISAHLTKTDEDNATGLSDRLENLAPITFEDNSDRDEFFTTLSNSFRHFGIAHDTKMRPWEWTADSDADGFPEFPPQFYVDTNGNGKQDKTGDTPVAAYAPLDPFRPQVRRLLFTEAIEGRSVQGQLPISLNQILDVNRTAQTPQEGTPEFQTFIRRSGLRFRPLTEHLLATEVDGGGSTARESVTVIPTVTSGSPLPVFPPKTFEEREFWARRDRQQLARDLFVLLYTIGGAEFDTVTVPNQVLDYTANNSDRSRYSEDRLRLMAQFAVNVVDSMDSDNVITKFEFDKNLADGWNLDDDAYTFSATSDPASAATTTALNMTRDGMYPDDAADRGVVYGVEAQQLAFSEVLGIRSRNTGNNVGTPYDDSRGGTSEPTYFLFTELQNMLPSTVVLGSGLTSGDSAGTSIWRLVRKDRTNKADPVQLQKEKLPLPAPSATRPAYLAIATNARNAIDGGGRFTIGATTATGGTVPSSDFFVDVGNYDTPTTSFTGDFDDTYELIAPNSPNGSFPTTTTPATDAAWTPRCDLDLIAHPTAYYESATEPFLPNVAAFNYQGHTGLLSGDGNTDGDGNPATPAAPATDTVRLESILGGTNEGFDLVLERRLNPDLPAITSEIQNPWIEVDRVRVELKNFDIDSADVANDLRTDLKAVISAERNEPLRNRINTHPTVISGLLSYRSNSLKGDTNTAPTDTLGANSGNSAFKIWQPHFDREFASAGELLRIPVFPPNMLTQRLDHSRRPPFQQLLDDTSTLMPRPLKLMNAAGAAAMFLWPDWTPDVAGDSVADDNRWYRLFQFVEVPSRVNRMTGNYVSLKRIPGKLNPNMMRDREIYAGLLDDTQFLNTNPLGDFNGNGDLDGPFGSGILEDGNDTFPNLLLRDRWLEFVNERDGNVESVKDPTPALRNSGDELQRKYWIPGTPNSRPFRSFNSRQVGGTDDNGFESTMFRRLSFDKPREAITRTNMTGEDPMTSDYNNAPGANNNPLEDSNRNWLEVGDRVYHKPSATENTDTVLEHHQQLLKVMNNTTTVSNTFIMYGTAAYFEVSEDPLTGLIQVGGRMGLDLDGDSSQTNDAGWEQRAVFIIDRTELYNAYDPGSGSIDWKRLVKQRVNLSSDSQ